MYSKTFFIFIILFGNIYSSFSNTKHNFKKCFFDEMRSSQSLRNNNYAKSIDSMEQVLFDKQFTQLNSSSSAQHKMVNGLTIPVVFHIIHNNGSENISDVQVNNVVSLINDAFSHNGYYNTGLGVNTNIQFCLATEDEFGNSSTGINRIQNSLTNMALGDELTVKNLSRWDPTKYLNIWVVKSIGGGSIAGFSYLASNHGSVIDGILIDDNYVSNNESNTAILIHEIGHYCNLYHTFEGGCSNNDCLLSGDKVCDTPPDNDTFQGANCGSYNSCSTDADDLSINNPFNTDVNDMDYLFMDYSFYNCFSAFTQGQADRMYNSLTTFRPSLFANNPCNPTNNSNNNIEEFTVSFFSNNNNICENESVTFTSNSNQTNLLYNWSFAGATPSSSNLPNPTINYVNQGTFNVSLTVTNLNGQVETSLQNNFITVNNSPNQPIVAGKMQYCENENFEPLLATGNNITWYDAATNLNETSNNFTPTNATTILVFNEQNGCESLPVFIEIIVTPTPEKPIITGETTFCEGEDFSNILAFGTSIEWKDLTTNNITFGNIFEPTLNTNLIVTQAVNNCTSEPTEIEIEIVSKPIAPIISGKIEYCANESFDPLLATGNNVLWYDISNASSYNGNSFTPFSDGLIYATQTINGCESNYAEATITINDTTNIQFLNILNNYQANAPIVLEALPSGGTFFGDGIFVNTFNPSLINTNTSEIFYSYTNNFGCTSTISESIQIINETTNVVTDLHTVNPLLPTLQLGLLLNPNNVSNFLNIFINNTTNKNINLAITNLSGEVIFTDKVNATENYKNKHQISSLNKGLYFVTIFNEYGKTTKKILIN